jgi:hypothetical protein
MQSFNLFTWNMLYHKQNNDPFDLML